jgi:hypothetical protein
MMKGKGLDGIVKEVMIIEVNGNRYMPFINDESGIKGIKMKFEKQGEVHVPIENVRKIFEKMHPEEKLRLRHVTYTSYIEDGRKVLKAKKITEY